MILSILAKIAFGAFLGGIVGAIVTGGDWIYLVVLFVAFGAFIFLGLAGGARRLRSMPHRGAAGLALARVETVQRTGREQDGDQEVEVRYTVSPADAPPFVSTMTTFIPTDELRRYTAGAVLVVSRVTANEPAVVVISGPPDEWRVKAAAAQADPSLIPAVPVVAPPAPRPQPNVVANRIIAIGIILASAAVTLIPVYGLVGRTATNVATGNWDGNNMLTGSYQQLAVDEIAAVVGNYEFRNVYFYDDYVIVSAPTTPGSRHADSYMYRYGRAYRDGPELIQPDDIQSELFDASGLDFGVVAQVVERSIAQARIDGRDFALAYVVLSDTGPTIEVAISGTYDDAYFSYDFTGAELDRSGSAFP